MTTEFAPLVLKPLPSPARLADLALPTRVGLDDPAESVMTDLREVRAGYIRRSVPWSRRRRR